MTIARVALPVALDRSFDYWAPDGLALSRGSIVRVRLARRPMVGVIIEIASQADVDRESLQPIDEVAPLPPLQREALILAEYEELSLEEIARAVESETGTVKSRLHRARENLRRMLAPLKPANGVRSSHGTVK